MPELYYDLHIHSCLSPCGDDDMTPANIAAMSALKGLDVIALTDHNSCRNCPAIMEEAEKYGLIAIPGMEINTSEEVHAVCLFAELDAAMAFDSYVYDRLIPVPNREDIFGKQQIYNANDEVCGTIPNLLINATSISFDGLWELVRSYGGVMFPAHIDNPSNSLIANLGFVPPDSRFRTVEIWRESSLPELIKSNPYLEKCLILNDSDAHYLGYIHEAQYTLKVRERTAEAVITALLEGNPGT